MGGGKRVVRHALPLCAWVYFFCLLEVVDYFLFIFLRFLVNSPVNRVMHADIAVNW
jgi:hypothetical protein